MSWFRRKQVQGAAREASAGERLGDVLSEVRRIEVDSTRLITDVLAGGYRSTFRGTGVEFADVREYVEGDDPRRVDWNVTARLGRPFVKRFVEERERTIVFVLDLSPSMSGSFGTWSTRQAAARFCAVIGLAAVQNHDRVGLIAGSGRVERFVLPKRGAGHVLRVVRDCVEMQATAAPSGMAEMTPLLAHAAGRLRRRAVLFLLSDFLSPLPANELGVCARRHDLVAVRLSPRELLQPPLALLRVVDPETGAQQVVDFSAASVRAAWQRRVARWRAEVDDRLARSGVDCIDVSMPAAPDVAAIVAPLLRFFRRRELRKVRR